MAETTVVSTVDHTKGAESATSGAEEKDVPRQIVHENADEKAPSAMQKVTEAVAQGVQRAHDAVTAKADLGNAPSAQPAPITNHQSHV